MLYFHQPFMAKILVILPASTPQGETSGLRVEVAG